MQTQADNAILNVSPKRVAKYTLLPGVLPRLRRIVLHLSQFMFMFTQIFGAVGLIERNHPCLRPENIGMYRFRDIIGLAASNVVFDKKHIPQIVMFFAVVLSIALTTCIGVGCILVLLMKVNAAHAQFFGTPQDLPVHPTTGAPAVDYDISTDWALLFLSRIFGEVGGMFPAAIGGNAWYSAILIGMLKYYSLALLLIAAFMIMYLLLITVVESARTGQPFGTKFDTAWAPIRLAIAIGLLIPIASGGYNSAQLITFQAAKWGSNLATNTWYGGLQQTTTDSEAFFSSALTDPGYRFTRDMFLVNLCVKAVAAAYKVDATFDAVATDDKITYNFGTEKAPDFCGQVTFLRSPDSVGGSVFKPPGVLPTRNAAGVNRIFTEQVIDDYVAIIKDFLPVPDNKIIDGDGVLNHVTVGLLTHTTDGTADVAESLMGPVVQLATNEIISTAPSANENVSDYLYSMQKDSIDVQAWIDAYRNHLGYDHISKLFFTGPVYGPMIKNYNDWLISSLRKDAKYGWTTAGVFYMRMSTAMSTIDKVVGSPPTVTRLPANLTKPFATPDNPTANTSQVTLACSSTWRNLWGVFTSDICERYTLAKQINTFLVGGKDWFAGAVRRDKTVYAAMGVQDFDRALALGEPQTANNADSDQVMSPLLKSLTGLSMLSSAGLNPMGGVITWGNEMMKMGELAWVAALVAPGGLATIAQLVAAICMFVGFILAFWIPMIPFVYFMFAVIEWMVSILEAVIGMPLFALSFISLQGDGVGSAMDNIKRLFEIILRPTVIVMSLLVSVILFTACIRFVNDSMALYNDAVSGSMFSSAILGFGMTFIYVFTIYTLATSCFKLIDDIPNQFGKWARLPNGFNANLQMGISGIRELTELVAAKKGFDFAQSKVKFGVNSVRGIFK